MFSSVADELLITCLLYVAATGADVKVYQYGLDNQELCRGRSVFLQKLQDTDLIVMKGKTNEIKTSSTFQECTIKFSPSSRAKKRSTMIVFESFHIYDCGTYLLVQQSPSEFFDRELSTLFNLTCDSTPGNTKFYTVPDNYILITLHKIDHTKFAYNFIFNISLTDSPPEPAFSTRILIGVGILIAIAIPGVLCVLFKYMKVRRWSKRQEEGEEELTPGSLQPLRRFPIGTSSESTNRYSSMPTGDGSSTPTHTHTCIIESIGPDGRCTVCNQMHENYSHFHVTSNPDNQTNHHNGTTDLSNRCHLCHRSHEDFAHFIEVDGTTRVLNDPVQNSGHSHSHRHHRRAGEHSRPCRHQNNRNNQNHEDNRQRNGSNLSVPTDVRHSYSDEDLDLSENDLIPPSYDLEPPSYDEAIHMPKPSSHTQDDSESDPLSYDEAIHMPKPSSHAQGDSESDPLYINIDRNDVSGL